MSGVSFLFGEQTTAYEMRISDWSPGVCSSDLAEHLGDEADARLRIGVGHDAPDPVVVGRSRTRAVLHPEARSLGASRVVVHAELLEGLGEHPSVAEGVDDGAVTSAVRSEEHTSELQSLMRISFAVFCLKKTK